MRIVNKTDVNLYCNGGVLEPGTTNGVWESIFNTLNIHSDIGSSEIVTEYSKRTIKNFGKIIVEETDELDESGLPVIVVRK